MVYLWISSDFPYNRSKCNVDPIPLEYAASSSWGWKIAGLALFVKTVTVVCIVVSISFIPAPEMIGTISLIDFCEVCLFACLNTLFLSLYWLDGLTSMTGLLDLLK